MTVRYEDIKEGIEVILAEMAKWHGALAALHEDVRQLRHELAELKADLE